MLGRFKAQVVSAGVTTYQKDGQTKPRFVVKVKCIPSPDQKDAQGKQAHPFIREWSGTYNEGDNQKYTDEAIVRMGYLYQEDNFADFDDLANAWNADAAFEVVIDERPGQEGTPNAGKMFEFVKSIWEVQSTEIKNAIAKDQVVSVMAGLTLPGHAAAMREKIKAKNGGKMPEKKVAHDVSGSQPNPAPFAQDDIPFSSMI
jgi:hypothetical protein